MEIFFVLALLALGLHALKSMDQGRRIALLGSHLGKYQIEKLMENLTQGYLRCLGEDDPARRDQIWQLLATTEASLVSQFDSFATEFARVEESEARVTLLTWPFPYAQRVFPRATFDVRKAFAIHARGMADTVNNIRQQSPRDKAFTMSAELFLMQHTCHWFCKSKNIASARMLVRHNTTYAQLIDSVSPATRQAYLALVRAQPVDLR